MTRGVGLVQSGGLRSGTWYPCAHGAGTIAPRTGTGLVLRVRNSTGLPTGGPLEVEPVRMAPVRAVPHTAPPARPATRGPRRLAAIVAVAFAVTSIGVLAVPRHVYAWDAGSFSSSSEKQLVSLTNQSRASAGLKALKVDSTLTSIARWRSKDMITRNYFSHNVPPSGYNVFAVLDKRATATRSPARTSAGTTTPTTSRPAPSTRPS